MSKAPFLTQYDTIVEAYESEDLLARIQKVLNEKGVLTASEYQHELQEARADGQRRFEARHSDDVAH